VWYALAFCAILTIGAALLYWKNRADESAGHKAVAETRAAKVAKLEEAANRTRQEEHAADVEEAKQVLEAKDVKLSTGFLRDVVHKARPSGDSSP
jgi:hypothetical protein